LAGWFDLDLGVMVDGTRVSLVPALLDLIADEDAPMALDPKSLSVDEMPPLLVLLADGRLLARRVLLFSQFTSMWALIEASWGASPCPTRC